MHVQMATCISGQRLFKAEAMAEAALSAAALRCVSTTVWLPWLHAAAQWDYEANAALGTPDTVVANSIQPVGWHCQVCGHKWTVSPNSRAKRQSGCPNVCPQRGSQQASNLCRLSAPTLGRVGPQAQRSLWQLPSQHNTAKSKADILAARQVPSRAGAQLVSNPRL